MNTPVRAEGALEFELEESDAALEPSDELEEETLPPELSLDEPPQAVKVKSTAPRMPNFV